MKLVAPLEVGIAVADLDRMLSFYREVLDLEHVSVHDVRPDKGRDTTVCAQGYRIVRLQTNTGERIKLAQPGTSPPSDDGGGEVLARRGLAFLTFIVEDLDAMIRHLKEHGTRMRTGDHKIELRDGVFAAFAEDPEGNHLEFVEYADVRSYRSHIQPGEAPQG